MLPLRHADPAHAAGHNNPATGAILLLQVDCAVRHRLLGRGHRQLNEAAHVAMISPRQRHSRIPLLYLSGQMDLLGSAVVLGDGADAAHPFPYRLPGSGQVMAQGIDRPHASNQNSAFFHS